jgi:hypothetical protein
MQQAAAANSPSPSSSSFAVLLASLAAPAATEANRATDRTDIDLGEDVVTLSYERALRSHTHYKPANLSVWEADSDTVAAAAGVPQLPCPDSPPSSGFFNRKKPPCRETEGAPELWNRTGSVAGASAGPTDHENVGQPVNAGTWLQEQARTAEQAVARRESRSASVTIRLSNRECVQLRQRAAEAGLTVSAYLRSCVLEADSLRAQVRQALAELRLAGKSEKPTASNPAATKPTRRPRFGWLARIWPLLHFGQRVARV